MIEEYLVCGACGPISVRRSRLKSGAKEKAFVRYGMIVYLVRAVPGSVYFRCLVILVVGVPSAVGGGQVCLTLSRYVLRVNCLLLGRRVAVGRVFIC